MNGKLNHAPEKIASFILNELARYAVLGPRPFSELKDSLSVIYHNDGNETNIGATFHGNKLIIHFGYLTAEFEPADPELLDKLTQCFIDLNNGDFQQFRAKID